MTKCNANPSNSHPVGLFSSSEGVLTGCTSCNTTGVPQAFGLKGGGHGFGKNDIVGNHVMTPNKYKGCHVESSMKLGAGQKGGKRNPLAPTASDIYSQTTAVGYGYNSGVDNKTFVGSGYPEISATTRTNRCSGGSKKKKRKTHKKRKKIKKKKKHKRKTKKTRKHKRKTKTKRKTKKHKRKTKKHRRGGNRQRGGYRQFQSDIPLAYTMQTPNGTQGGTWKGQLSSPPTYKAINNCQDNYNHYKQK